MILLVLSLVVLGLVFLVVSLTAICRLLAELAPGPLRRSWVWLGMLNIGVMVGFMCLIVLMANLKITPLSYVVAMLAASGGGFVMAVSRLSCNTAQDLRRMAVLEQAVITDPLTGLYNRRYLDARMEEEVERARRYALPLSVLMIDLDHFKAVNDRLGHATGDVVLRRVGQLLTRLSRPSDTVARYGGEEMMIVAPHSPADEVHAFAERLCRAIAAEDIRLEDGRALHVTTSIGYACLATSDTPAMLLSRADAALYLAKRTGRNRVCTETDLAAALAA